MVPPQEGWGGNIANLNEVDGLTSGSDGVETFSSDLIKAESVAEGGGLKEQQETLCAQAVHFTNDSTELKEPSREAVVKLLDQPNQGSLDNTEGVSDAVLHQLCTILLRPIPPNTGEDKPDPFWGYLQVATSLLRPL